MLRSAGGLVMVQCPPLTTRHIKNPERMLPVNRAPLPPHFLPRSTMLHVPAPQYDGIAFVVANHRADVPSGHLHPRVAEPSTVTIFHHHLAPASLARPRMGPFVVLNPQDVLDQIGWEANPDTTHLPVRHQDPPRSH